MREILNRRIMLAEECASGSRQSYIEFLKGLSILTIVLFHIDFDFMPDAPPILLTVIGPFMHATRIFFFCSGFGLYYSYLRHPVTYPAFLKKRFQKVYLSYILVAAICAIVPYTYEYSDRFAAFLSHVFLYKMFIPKYCHSFGPFWYMSAIFQYYLLFYALIRMKEKIHNDRIFLLIWTVISLVWCTLAWRIPQIEGTLKNVYGTFILLHAWIFTLGMLMAQELRKRGSFSVSWKQLIICLLTVFPVYLFVGKNSLYLNEIPRAVLILCLFTICWAVCGKTIRQFVQWIGSFSFEWYLVHMVLVEGIFRLLKPVGFLHQALTGILGLTVSGLAGWLYHQFVTKVIYRGIL